MLPKSLQSQIRRLVDRLAPIEGVSTLNALVFQLSSHAHLCSVSSIYLSCPPFLVLEQLIFEIFVAVINFFKFDNIKRLQDNGQY